MNFYYPAMLLLLIPIWIFLYFLYKKQVSYKSISFPIENSSMGEFSSNWVARILFFIKALILTGLVVCLARPQTLLKYSQRTTSGIDIMIAFDVSKSMLVEDYNEQSRLNLGKQTIKDFIKGRKDDQIGFLMFSGEGATLCPPTLDYGTLLAAVELADTDQLKDGTAIGDALAGATNRLKDSKSKSKIIILITDGDNNMGSVAPLTAGGIAKGYGIKVYSIALGRRGANRIPIIDRRFGRPRKIYQTINTTINPALLKKISKETGGKFFRAEKEGSLERVFKEIDRLERSKIKVREQKQKEENFQYFLILTLLLIIVELILSKTRLRILPN